jgi:hypothetical protein
MCSKCTSRNKSSLILRKIVLNAFIHIQDEKESNSHIQEKSNIVLWCCSMCLIFLLVGTYIVLTSLNRKHKQHEHTFSAQCCAIHLSTSGKETSSMAIKRKLQIFLVDAQKTFQVNYYLLMVEKVDTEVGIKSMCRLASFSYLVGP